MTASSYSRLAGAVFALVAILQLARALAGLCPKPERSPLNSGAGARMLCITACEGSRYKIYIGGRLPSALESHTRPATL